jgi:hypothetical protein
MPYFLRFTIAPGIEQLFELFCQRQKASGESPVQALSKVQERSRRHEFSRRISEFLQPCSFNFVYKQNDK